MCVYPGASQAPSLGILQLSGLYPTQGVDCSVFLTTLQEGATSLLVMSLPAVDTRCLEVDHYIHLGADHAKKPLQKGVCVRNEGRGSSRDCHSGYSEQLALHGTIYVLFD